MIAESRTMSKLMIMSLGGSPEPLKTSINAHHPERIFFWHHTTPSPWPGRS